MSIETQEYAALDAMLRAELPADLPSPDFANRVLRAAEQRSRSSASTRRWALAAAVLVLCFGGVFWFSAQTADPADRHAKPSRDIAQIGGAPPPLHAPTSVRPRPPSAALVSEVAEADAPGLRPYQVNRLKAVVEQVGTALCGAVIATGGPPKSLAACLRLKESKPRPQTPQTRTKETLEPNPRPARRSRPRKPAPVLTDDAYERGMSTARQLFVEGDKAAAIQVLVRLRAARPSKRTPLQMLCSLFSQTGRIEEAIKACRGWAKLEPNRSYRERAKRKASELEAILRSARP